MFCRFRACRERSRSTGFDRLKPWREALHREDGWSRKLQSPTMWIMAAGFFILVVGALVLPVVKKLRPQPHIVVYTSQDTTAGVIIP